MMTGIPACGGATVRPRRELEQRVWDAVHGTPPPSGNEFSRTSILDAAMLASSPEADEAAPRDGGRTTGRWGTGKWLR